MAKPKNPVEQKRKRVAKCCTLRQRLLLRWVHLADATEALEQAIESAPPGTFTEAELKTAAYGLGFLAWEGFNNHRPRLTRSGGE